MYSKFTKVYSLLFTLISLNTQSTKAVQFGSEINATEAPYIVRLSTNCTGSFVGHRVIVTARHCVADSSYRGSVEVWNDIIPEVYFLTSNETKRNKKNTLKVEKIFYIKDSSKADIALILTDRMPNNINTIPLAKYRLPLLASFSFIGYGLNETLKLDGSFNSVQSDGVLRIAYNKGQVITKGEQTNDFTRRAFLRGCSEVESKSLPFNISANNLPYTLYIT